MNDPTAYFARSAGEMFLYGESDCGFWTGAWAEECCGVNPAAAMRGRYKTEAGCVAAVKRRGGLQALVTRLMAQHGFSVLAEPEPGAIGLIDTAEAGPTLGIMAKTGRWVCKGAPTGVVFPKGPILMMWSPVCRS